MMTSHKSDVDQKLDAVVHVERGEGALGTVPDSWNAEGGASDTD